MIFGPVAAEVADLAVPLVIGLAETVQVTPQLDFFSAQSQVEKRPKDRAFDDVIVLTENGAYEGLVPMLELIRMQIGLLRWQESELWRRADELLTAKEQGRGRRAREERIPGRHEPRDPHADEWRDRHDQHPVRDRAERDAARLRADDPVQRRIAALGHQRHLDFSKMESGGMQLEATSFHLRQCVEEALGLFAPQIRLKGLERRTSSRRKCRCNLTGDALRLRQILVNLIGNAVKFTAKGEVTLEVKHERADDDGCRLLFSVTDSGIGIPRESVDKLFQAVRAGRCLDHAALRRHRPRPGH